MTTIMTTSLGSVGPKLAAKSLSFSSLPEDVLHRVDDYLEPKYVSRMASASVTSNDVVRGHHKYWHDRFQETRVRLEGGREWQGLKYFDAFVLVRKLLNRVAANRLERSLAYHRISFNFLPFELGVDLICCTGILVGSWTRFCYGVTSNLLRRSTRAGEGETEEGVAAVAMRSLVNSSIAWGSLALATRYRIEALTHEIRDYFYPEIDGSELVPED